MPDLLIPKLVLTGGPCGGKSTAQSILRQKLAEFGVSVVVVPEVATQIFTNGIDPSRALSDPIRALRFQREMLRTQITLEDRWEGFAKAYPAERICLLCDRGALDPGAYLPPGSYHDILADEGLSLFDVREGRYAAVFHLVSAAVGAEPFYNLANAARTEDVESARALDARTLAAWTGHPRLEIFNNTETGQDDQVRNIGFEEKMDRLVRSACRELGLPVPHLLQRKFRTRGADTLPDNTSSTRIEQTYLTSHRAGVERRVRRITTVDSSARGALHVYCEKVDVRPGVRVPSERVLSEREYLALLREADPRRVPIMKVRHAFTWQGQYFRLDDFAGPESRCLLEIDVAEEQPDVAIPPFVHVEGEVTRDEAYRNAAIALR